MRWKQERNRRFVSNFEEFLSKDHKRSMSILERADREAKLTDEICARRNELAKQHGQIRLDIYFWEENWRMVKMCQLFLYRLSPTAWRIKHDWLHRLETGSLISVNAGDLFQRYGTPDDDATLEDLIGDLRVEMFSGICWDMVQATVKIASNASKEEGLLERGIAFFTISDVFAERFSCDIRFPGISIFIQGRFNLQRMRHTVIDTRINNEVIFRIKDR